MSKLLVVVGATGAQGGSIVRVLSEGKEWTVRGLTRNPSSNAAEKLKSDCPNVELVTADIDDEASLVKAFTGAQAIFAVTNFWEHLMRGMDQASAGEKERQQGITLARAAAKTDGLQEYIWSTLPWAAKLSGGKYPVAHLDYKAEVDAWIEKELPELAAKTIHLHYGFYGTNLVFLPLFKPVSLPYAQKQVLIMPCSSTTNLSITGDMARNGGVIVRQILANPEKTRGKHLVVATEELTLGEMLKTRSEVGGKEAVYLQVTPEDYGNIFGMFGMELTAQLQYNEAHPDWFGHLEREGLLVKHQEIGVQKGDLVSFKECLESFREML